MTINFSVEEGREHVGHLTIDAGEHNLIGPEVCDDLIEAVESVPESVSVLTIGPTHPEDDITGLTGGLNLNVVKDLGTKEAREMLDSVHGSMQAVRDLEAVTVCDCGSYAVGFGLELAMSCDFRIATSDAGLGLPEIEVGLVTGIEGGLMIRLIGLGRTKELIYTGKIISGKEAQNIGLVHHAGPPDEHLAYRSELLDNLAAKSPLIMRWQKQTFKTWRSASIDSGIEHSKDIAAACFDTDDTKEAFDAFLENRDPEFTGT